VWEGRSKWKPGLTSKISDKHWLELTLLLPALHHHFQGGLNFWDLMRMCNAQMLVVDPFGWWVTDSERESNNRMTSATDCSVKHS
jgi:hypothetical protein